MMKAPKKEAVSSPRRLRHPLTGMLALCALMATSTTSFAQDRDPRHQAYCLDLEGKLARLMQGNGSANIDRNKLKTSIRNVEGVYHRLNNEAERRNCYSYFLFSKELRRTPRCVRIDRKIRDAKRELARLNDQLHRSANSRQYDNQRKDELISALARNRCGQQYEREARRRNSFENWFGDGFFGGTPPRRDYGIEDQFKFATHRTLCVRLCDGYYFPVSFATTTNRFSLDADACQSRCAAPAELYTHPNPGGEAEQMISIQGVPYEKLKNAWRFRKEFVKGCSCKPAEYNPELIAANEAAKLKEQAAELDKKSRPDAPKDDAKQPEATEKPLQKTELESLDAGQQLASEKKATEDKPADQGTKKPN